MTSADTKQGEGTFYFFGMRVDTVRYDTALGRIGQFIARQNGSGAGQVFFANVHSFHLARRNPEFLHSINRADMVLPDGSGLRLAGKLFGTPIIENLNGTDFTPRILSEAEQHGWTVYLLGAQPHVVEQCRERIAQNYPRLSVVGFRHGHFLPGEVQFIVEDININKPNILLVALGSPYQEEWIAHHARHLNVGVCLAVGGLFDFLSGARKRAPRWLRGLGMEWVYRFVQEPRQKWGRIFVEIPSFLLLLVASRFAAGQLSAVTTGRRSSSRTPE